PPELHHPLWPEADQAPEPDELRAHLALELVDLGEAPCLHELLQARLDRRPDAAPFAHPAPANEVCHRRGCPADELGCAPVGTDAEAVRTGEIEQCSQGLEALGD